MYFFIKDLYQTIFEIYSKNAQNIQRIKDRINKSAEEDDQGSQNSATSSLASKIGEALTNRIIVLCLRAEKGIFELPLHSLFRAYDEIKLKTEAAKLDNPLSCITFEGFKFGIENKLEWQNVVLNLRNMKVSCVALSLLFVSKKIFSKGRKD